MANLPINGIDNSHMRVGIITFHRANNYGATLQCYALQRVLIKLGYVAEVIDYRQPFIETLYKPVKWNVIREGFLKPRLLGGYLFKVLPMDFRKMLGFDHFRKRLIHQTKKFSKSDDMPQDFDVYLVGSDQMWNLDLYGGKMDSVYFGDFHHPETSSLATYAVSTDFKALAKIGRDAMKIVVKRFANLSFREQAICDEVKHMTGVSGRSDVDPTLLLGGSEWAALCKDEKKLEGKYLLTYFMHKIADKVDFNDRVNRLAARLDCKVVNVHDVANSPDEFLSAIRHARCVVTSSFHAVVFSVLFNKTFYAVNSHNGREIRYESLLHSLGLSEQYIEAAELDRADGGTIDYSFAMQRLEEMRRESIKYLSEL